MVDCRPLVAVIKGRAMEMFICANHRSDNITLQLPLVPPGGANACNASG